MNNPLRILSALFNGPAQPPAPAKETPPPAPADDPAIKVEVPADVAAATEAAATVRPKLPRESFKQHNREVEQRVKAANQHRPVVITRSLPHARGR